MRLSSWRKQVEIFMLRRCWKSRLIKSTGSCFMCLRSASPNIQFMNNPLLPWISQKFLRVAPTKKTEALLEALEKDVSKGNKVLKSPNANMSSQMTIWSCQTTIFRWWSSATSPQLATLCKCFSRRIILTVSASAKESITFRGGKIWTSFWRERWKQLFAVAQY